VEDDSLSLLIALSGWPECAAAGAMAALMDTGDDDRRRRDMERLYEDLQHARSFRALAWKWFTNNPDDPVAKAEYEQATAKYERADAKYGYADAMRTLAGPCDDKTRADAEARFAMCGDLIRTYATALSRTFRARKRPRSPDEAGTPTAKRSGSGTTSDALLWRAAKPDAEDPFFYVSYVRSAVSARRPCPSGRCLALVSLSGLSPRLFSFSLPFSFVLSSLLPPLFHLSILSTRFETPRSQTLSRFSSSALSASLSFLLSSVRPERDENRANSARSDGEPRLGKHVRCVADS
jgi:hypothetical protein